METAYQTSIRAARRKIDQAIEQLMRDGHTADVLPLFDARNQLAIAVGDPVITHDEVQAELSRPTITATVSRV